MNKKGFFGIIALFVGIMLVLGGGQAFAQKATWKQNFVDSLDGGTYSRNTNSAAYENLKLVTYSGSGQPTVVEYKGKGMVPVSDATNPKNIVGIRTTQNPPQYVDLVMWSYTKEWTSPYARRVTYYQIQPGTTIVFDDHGGRSFSFYVKSGSVKVDVNVPRTGEALEFIGLVMFAMKDTGKIKKKVNDLKISSTAERIDKVISNGVNNAGWFGALSGSVGLFALPAQQLVVQKQYMLKAELAYGIACAYGLNRTDKEFEYDLLYLFSGMTVGAGQGEAVKSVAKDALEDVAWKAAEIIAKDLFPKAVGYIPFVSIVTGSIAGGWEDRGEAQKFAERTKKYYKAVIEQEERNKAWAETQAAQKAEFEKKEAERKKELEKYQADKAAADKVAANADKEAKDKAAADKAASASAKSTPVASKPATNTREQCQKVIQDKCKFGTPTGVWNAINKHANPDSVYKKWAESYSKSYSSTRPGNQTDKQIIAARCGFSAAEANTLWDVLGKTLSDPNPMLKTWAGSYYK